MADIKKFEVKVESSCIVEAATELEANEIAMQAFEDYGESAEPELETMANDLMKGAHILAVLPFDEDN